jgi:hypothetical protein
LPPLIDQHVVRTYILFSDKLAKPQLPPNMFVIHNFLYWIAFNLGYRSATIKIYRYVLQDYFEENGYYLTDQTRIDLWRILGSLIYSNLVLPLVFLIDGFKFSSSSLKLSFSSDFDLLLLV